MRLCVCAWVDPEGGGGAGGPDPPPPLKNHNTIGFPSNTGLDPLIISRLPSQHSMLGHLRYDSETPFVGVADVGPLMVVFGSSLSSSTKKKTLSKSDSLSKEARKYSKSGKLL